jgi:hypothetical protein
MNQSRDTETYIGTALQKFTTEQLKMNSNPDCGSEGQSKIIYDNQRITLNGTGNKKIELLMSMDNSKMFVSFGSAKFEFFCLDISNRNFPTNVTFDSIALETGTFYNVTIFGGTTKSSDKLYINKTEGIVRMVLKDSTEIWNKIK